MLDRKLNTYKRLTRIRKRQQDWKAQELAAIQRERMTLEERRASIYAAQQNILNNAQDRKKYLIDAWDIQRYYQFERHLARLGDDTDAEIRTLESQEDSCRDALTEAMKLRRMMEQLANHESGRVSRHLLKTEQRLLDEIATVRYGTRRQTEKSSTEQEKSVQEDERTSP